MPEAPAALDKLYSMLREADQLGLSRSVRLSLIGIIGSLENEELDRYRRAADEPGDQNADSRHRQERDSEGEYGRGWEGDRRVGHSRR